MIKHIPVEKLIQQDMTTERKEGLMLVAKMRPLVNSLVVKTAEDYLEADELLAKIRGGRSTWKARMAKILTPLKESQDAAKKAYKSAEILYDEIDSPMLQIESSIKQLMANYKVEERRILQAAEEESRRQQAEIERQLREKEAAEAKAKTPAMTSKIMEAKARLQQALSDKKSEGTPKAVKASASTARTTKKYRITDMEAFIKYIGSGVDPDLVSLLEINKGQMEAYFRLQKPEVGNWMPGTEVYEEINIAGK